MLPSSIELSRTYGSWQASSATFSGSSIARGDDDRVARHPLLELARGAADDDLAVIHDHDPVAQRVGLFEVVRGEEDGRAALAKPADVLPEVRPVLRVEAGRGLVEEEHLRVVHDAEGNVEAPDLAAGVGLHLAVGELAQVEHVHELLAAGEHVGLGAAVEPALQQQVLPAGRRAGRCRRAG